VRIPRIARDVVARGAVSPAAAARLERLASDIEGDAPLPVPGGPGPDVARWERDHASRAGETWLSTEWFYAELAFYFEVARACRYWETDKDPFADVKDEELAGRRPWERLEAALSGAGSREQRLNGLLEAALWGNRVDLSYTVAATRTETTGDLLVDDRPAALPRLVARGCNLHVVADNTGAELALDLALAACVLEDEAARVTVHVKMQPVFVSDATARDVWRLVERMRAAGGDSGRLSHTIEAQFEAGRLALAPHPFWSGPRFLWDAPEPLRRTLDGASLVVVKGDANYRRVVGDAMWPPSARFGEACGYLQAPAVCLRTMKSDPVLGLPDGLAERLDASEPRWRVDGRRGVIQTSKP
jgi:uncharacterized protein with ATP-grasp and redox domains